MQGKEKVQYREEKSIIEGRKKYNRVLETLI
jgi:hypothetical protein